MQHAVLINDERADGQVINQLMLQLPCDCITVEKLLEMRLAEERTLYGKTLNAFRENGFWIRIGKKRVTNLQEEVKIGTNTPVSFVELQPER